MGGSWWSSFKSSLPFNTGLNQTSSPASLTGLALWAGSLACGKPGRELLWNWRTSGPIRLRPIGEYLCHLYRQSACVPETWKGLEMEKKNWTRGGGVRRPEFKAQLHPLVALWLDWSSTILLRMPCSFKRGGRGAFIIKMLPRNVIQQNSHNKT